MSTFNITNSADTVIAPVAWTRQREDQAAMDHFTSMLAQATTRRDTTKSAVRDIVSQIVSRAGSALPEGEQVTNVVANQDGSVTITSA